MSGLQQNDIFKGESLEFCQEMMLVCTHNKFVGNADLKEFIFAQFEDFDFNIEGLVVTGKHKAAIRRIIDFANKQHEKGQSEEGEVNAMSSEAEERLKLFSEIMDNATKKSKKVIIHVQTAQQLSKHCGNWGEALPAMLPSSEPTNHLAAELAKVSERGVKVPFVHVAANKFTPEWHLEKSNEGYLLQPGLLSPALLRWAIAAQATGMLPMHAGVTHADICMRVAAEARNKNKYSISAAVYDELIQKHISEMSLKGVDGLDPVAILSKLDREVMEQAFEIAASRMKPSGNGYQGHGQQGHKTNWKRPYNASYDQKWSSKKAKW